MTSGLTSNSKSGTRRRQPPAIYAVRAHVARFLRALSPQRVLVACSGGPDSTVLLDAVAAVGDFSVHVAAVDHGLRPEALAEAEQVVTAARARGLAAEVLRVTVGRPSQEGARGARYDALVAEAGRVGADVVCVGHTASDQLETLIDRLLRGAGIKGLAAMRPVRPLATNLRLARPLLPFSRADIEAYLAALSPAPLVVRDPSNENPRYLRSRIRHRIVPLLVAERADLEHAVGDLCRQLAADDEALTFATTRALAEVTDGGAIDVGALGELPAGLRARVLLRAVGISLSSVQVQALMDLTATTAGSAELHLPGNLVAERRYATLRIAPRVAPVPVAAYVVSGPGRHPFGAGFVELDEATFARLGGPLILRACQPGDRTAAGRRLSRLLSDGKIARAERHRLPCLVRADAPSVVLWMATIFGQGPRFIDGNAA